MPTKKNSNCNTQVCQKCRDLLGIKIKQNFHRLSQGQLQTKNQAMKVSYNEVSKILPECRKILSRFKIKSKKTRKNSRSRK